MYTRRPNLPFHTFVIVLMIAMAIIGFSAAPNVQAQDINTPTPEAHETITPTPEVQIQATSTRMPDDQVLETVTPISEVEAQIIGGAPADPGEYPWQVALVGGSASDLYTGQFCAGSLIHPQWVLTAAHCVTEDNGSVSLASSVDIVAGIWDLDTPASGFQRKDVIQIIRHPSYGGSTFNNDIALLKLTSPVTIGNGANPPYTKTAIIPLVPADIGSLAGVSSQATGWGKIVYEPPTWDTELYEVQLPIISNSSCNASSRWGGQITSNMLCAGSDAGTQSTCQGDSGGPLVVWNAGTGEWNLAGVTSFGPIGCAVPRAPSVFVRVSQYGSWVNGYILDPALLTYPAQSQNIGTNYNPTYTWNQVLNSTHYYLWVDGPSGNVIKQWYTSAEANCNGSTCSVTPATTLGGGAHIWWVQTWNPVGYGPWSATANFSTATPTAPAATTLSSPSGNIGTNYNPTYTWNHVSNSTYYYLWVDGPNGNVIQQWYSSAQANCNGSICSVASPTLGGGAHTWKVQTWNSVGYGPFSSVMNFSTTIPPAPTAPAATTLSSPSGNIGTNYNPTYTWNQVSNSTYYLLNVSGPSGVVLNQWYSSSQANCNGSTCSVASPTLGGGAHIWKVQTWNSVGYGPFSSVMNFSTATPTAPAAATLTSPSGNIGSNYNPTYIWNQVSNSTYYLLNVSGPSGVVLNQWYSSAQANCNGSTCSVASPTLGGGAHTWKVQTWNSVGYGPFSTVMNFSTTIPTVPAAATLVSPINGTVVGTSTPTYTWNQVSNSTYYYLWVNGPSGNVIKQWYSSAQANCNGSTCSVTPATTLGGGAHTWWVQTWNSVGYGPWSTAANFAR